MPIVTVPQLSRRGFIAASAALLPLRAAAQEARWALFSDTHIPADANDAYRGFQPVVNLTMAVRQAVRTKPEGVILCGDVARLEGKTEDYEAVKPLIAPLMETTPFAMAMGNHDDRENFWKGFGTSQKGMESIKNRHVVVLDPGPVRFVVLDSLISANTTPGLLGKAQRTWLSGWLPKNTDKPVILFVHHTLDDGDGSLLDAPRLFDIVKGVPSVKAIVYGHSHIYRYDIWEGIHLINLPAIGYNFRDSDPVGWVESVFTAKGGHFTLRAIGGNTEKDGQIARLVWRS